MFGLSFATPWLLSALVLLPGLWWLLRLIPPTPRRVPFPALSLLLGLTSTEQSSARTPWWLILLRLVLVVLLILGAAGPMLNAQPPAVSGPLLLVVDDGWAAAGRWDERRAAMDGALKRAQRAEQPVILLPTAPRPDGSGVAASGPLPATVAADQAKALEPKAWPVDRLAAAKALENLSGLGGLQILWLADGVEDGQAAGFGERLSRIGRLQITLDPPGSRPHLLMPPQADGADMLVTVRRLEPSGPETVNIRLRDDKGGAVAREAVTFPADRTEATLRLALPPELRNRLARADIDGEQSAGATALLDEQWRRRPVGLVGGEDATPLLDGLYYVERALAPTAELRRGAVNQILERPLAMIVLADGANLTEDEHQRLEAWTEAGGLLLRFAGPQLSRAPDALLPIHLRSGGRTLGSALSWDQPMPLAPFAVGTPFQGLAIPDDVRVRSQVLAEPTPDLAGKTWARLSDGTPLVTSAERGKGRIVLLHTTADPSWSNLAMSGLFVDLLRRLVDISQGVAPAGQDQPLPPLELLDGFGRLTAPYGAASALAGPEQRPGPRTPPGYYGNGEARRAINLGPHVGELRPMPVPATASLSWFGAGDREVDLAPWLLLAALLLAVADFAAGLALRGLLGRGAVAAGAVLLMLAASPHAEASDARALKAGLETRLAYVLTGNPQIDGDSRAGLTGLSRVVSARSTALLGEPMGVDPATDELLFHPLLYWPVTGAEGPLPEPVRAKINDYLRQGGLILFDTRDGGQLDGGGASLAVLTDGLAIPPLAPLTGEHVLTRSFYLLRDVPGRMTGGQVWVDRNEGRINDGVSPVVIGGHDWAGAWAVDAQGRPLHAVAPGGETQRETAFRFGVNLVMYALTGNYKADQVHLPAILERLRR